MKLPAWLSFSLRLIVAAIFTYAGAVKVAQPARFATDIANYQLVPWSIAVRMAFYLPWLEIICGLALLIPFLRRGANVILLALISIFIVASIAAKARGFDVSCGCFGGASHSWMFSWHLLFDFAILAALVSFLQGEQYDQKNRVRLSSLFEKEQSEDW